MQSNLATLRCVLLNSYITVLAERPINSQRIVLPAGGLPLQTRCLHCTDKDPHTLKRTFTHEMNFFPSASSHLPQLQIMCLCWKRQILYFLFISFATHHLLIPWLRVILVVATRCLLGCHHHISQDLLRDKVSAILIMAAI